MDQTLTMPLPKRPRCGGFSLLELLVVIGIMVLVATIGVAAFQNFGKVNRLAAAEAAIATAIRDARNAARATGNPVIVAITSNSATNTTQVEGIARQSMWQLPMRENDFTDEDSSGSVSDAVFQEPPPIAGVHPTAVLLQANDGPTGACLTLSLAAQTSPETYWPHSLIYSATANAGHPERSERKRRLIRDQSRPEGFFLRCMVRAPSVTTTFTAQPLIIVSSETPAVNGTDKDSIRFPTISGSFAGLMLRPFEFISTESSGSSVVSKGWDLVGWVQGTEISAIENNNSNRDISGTAITAPFDSSSLNAQPTLDYIGASAQGREATIKYLNLLHGLLRWNRTSWHEVGLLWDTKNISLWIDGSQVSVALPASAPPVTTSDLYACIGYAFYNNNDRTWRNASYSANWVWASGSVNWVRYVDLPQSSEVIHPDTRVSDVGCFRLVGPEPRQLPGGIVLDGTSPFRLTALPDGRVTGAQNPIKFKGIFDQQDDKVTITVNPSNGSVTSDIKIYNGTSSP